MDVTTLIATKNLAEAKNLIEQKIQSIALSKLEEMKKITAAQMTEGKALDDALKKIDQVFGPGGEMSNKAVTKRTNLARMNDPEFQKWLDKKGKKNPYKKD